MNSYTIKIKKAIYFFGRLLAIVFAYSMYRLKVEGRENIPKNETVVYICNHVSFLDWLILSAVIPGKIRFVMTHKIWKIPIFGLLFRIFDAIPIAPKREDSILFEKAFESVRDTLARGESVFIFPEGMLTRDGNVCPFKRGIDRIVAETPVRVVPIALNGMWGSYFSHKDGKPFMRPFKRGFFNKVNVLIGESVSPEDATSENLQKIVEEMTNDDP